ncbi:MAG: hypothetical protein HN548_05155 [Opitutae bacterium]|nr:hypothetical protein [Opitutae bacterium]
MFEFNGWQFSAAISSVFGCSIIFGLSIFLSIRTWSKNGKKKNVAVLELLRTLSVLFLIITLLNPEKIEEIKKIQKPEIICLLDESRSMDTNDTIDVNGTLKSRLEWAKNILQLDWLQKLEANASVSIKPFSSNIGKGGTDLGSAIKEVIQDHSEIKAILLFSDGDSNTGPSALSTAGKLRGLKTPVYSVQVGSRKALPDLSLEDANAPVFVLKEEKINIPFRVKNYFENLRQVNIELLANEKLVLAKPLSLPASAEYTGNLTWLPPSDGNYTLKVKIPLIEDETILHNNEKTFQTRVESKVIKALLIDSLPRWEYRFLRNALNRDPGVDLKCLLFHPELKESSGKNYLSDFPQDFNNLAGFDVIFLGDVGIGSGELKEEDCDKLKKLIVQQASGMIFLPGRRGRQLSLSNSSLTDIMPVILDPNKPIGLGTLNPSNLELTNRGRDHWLTNLRGTGETDREFWERLPGFHWSAVVKKSRPGSEVLAVHSNFKNNWGSMPMLVIRYTGAGKTLYMGSDSAWRWRRGVEDKYHYRFWSQVVRWMAHGRYLAEKEGVRLITDPERPKVGEKIFLRCIALDKAGFPLENGIVTANIFHSDGLQEKITFSPTETGHGVYLAQMQAQNSGALKINIETAPFKRKLSVNVMISKDEKEKMGKPINGRQLQNLSELTGGKTSGIQNWKEVINELTALPNPEPVFRIHRLRSNSAWGLFLFSMLAIYWTGRKLLGMI